MTSPNIPILRYIEIRKTLVMLVAGLWLLSPASGLASPPGGGCDLNGDGLVNALDVQLATNMALGLSACTADVAGVGVCNSLLIQRIINAALTGNCQSGTAHIVAINWTPSASPNVIGYNVYRATVSGGPFTKLTAAPIATTSYLDSTAQAGQTYYYVATAVDSNNGESPYSASVSATVPAS